MARRETATQAKRKTGRPSAFTEDLGDRICERIADGDSLRTICDSDEMPDRTTVLRWLADDQHRSFAAKYARAREAQGDLMDEKVLAIADKCTPETAQADRVKIAAYQWRASKLKPKVYGDRLHQELTGPNGGPLQTEELSALTPDERKRRAMELAVKLGIKMEWPE